MALLADPPPSHLRRPIMVLSPTACGLGRETALPRSSGARQSPSGGRAGSGMGAA
jgi:hypothetical protein